MDLLQNPQYLDLRSHENTYIKGIWIPYDKAVELALKFDIYEITKKLFLVDVHDFEKLPKANKRVYEEDDDDTERDILDSPSKKQKLDKGPPVKGTFSNGVVDNNHVLIDALSSKTQIILSHYQQS